MSAATRSAAHAGASPALEDRNVRIGMLLFIVTEVMLFAAFFAAYFYLRSESATWPPAGALRRPELGLVSVNTVILMTSSISLQLAHAGGRAWRRWLALTIGLGATFLAIQVYEFSRNAFSIADGVFGGTFYTLTGFHGLHVAIGLLLLASMLRRARRGFAHPTSA
ncbi:MAG TPA: heme-copper oxidase subunit III, partial [Candidatus Limnocylindria bacterium]|nr:heme-copper oxidase subunit III [Candidatus Limnocylindria bacterium]